MINYIVIAVKEFRHSHATNNWCKQNKSDYISCEGKVNNAIFGRKKEVAKKLRNGNRTFRNIYVTQFISWQWIQDFVLNIKRKTH